MSTVVLKFGGTSLKDKESRKAAVDRIKEKLNQGIKPVIVVSAIGRKGSPYATDTLIELAKTVNNDFDNREKDLIMSCGEVISSVVMVQNLKDNGINAQTLTGAQAGILTDQTYCNSKVLNVNPEKILTW